jgi:hypothetical protein
MYLSKFFIAQIAMPSMELARISKTTEADEPSRMTPICLASWEVIAKSGFYHPLAEPHRSAVRGVHQK